MRADFEALKRRVAGAEQSHILRFWNELDGAKRDSLTGQIAEIEWEKLPTLVQDYVRNKPTVALPPDVQPAPCFPHDSKSPRKPWDRAKCRQTGEALIRAGKVAAFVVAGGQGSRLGYEGPKGCYPAGSVTGKPLFHVFADALLGVKDRLGVTVPWYILTSPLNHKATQEFFEANRHFGLAPDSVRLCVQGTVPSFDLKSGKLLLAQKHEIATNPDGHGGSLKALHVSGALADMKRRGVAIISYFQVDNPTVNFLDSAFIGLHAGGGESSGEMSSKMIPKAYPEEKLGMFCASGSGPRKGRVEVVEYSDLPMDLQKQRLPDDSLRFLAGSIAVHVLGRAFVEKLNTDAAFDLPYHRAEKKIPCIDTETGRPINPAVNNGVKLERFVFDALPMCERSIVLETDRIEEFAPIKNAEGVDSPASSREIQTERAARWLEFCGCAVPRGTDGKPDCVLEISGRTALTREDLKASGKWPRVIERGAKVVI